MKVMEAFKKGFSVTAGALNLLLTLSVYYIAAAFVRGAIMPKAQPQAWGASEWAVALPTGIVFLLLSIFVQAGIFGYVRDAVKSGRTALSKFPEYGKKFFFKVLSLWGLITLIIIVLFSIVTIVSSILIAAMGDAPIADILGGILFSIGGGLVIYLTILLFYSPYAIVVDGASLIQAVKKSAAFVRKNLLKVLGLGMIAVLFALGVGLLLGFILGIIKVLGATAIVSNILNTVFVSGINAYLNLVITASFMALYLDFNAQAGAWQPGPADVAKKAPSPEGETGA